MLSQLQEKVQTGFERVQKPIYMHRYSLRIFLRSETSRKDGRGLLYMQIRINGKIKSISMEIKILPEYWDHTRERAKMPVWMVEEQTDWNNAINITREKVENIFRKARGNAKPLSMDSFMVLYYRNDESLSFSAFMQRKLDEITNGLLDGRRTDISAGTLKVEKRALKYLNEFKSNLLFHEFNSQFTHAWRRWLAAKYDHNTVVGLMKKIKKYVDIARREDLQIGEPFKGIKLVPIPKDMIYLEAEELRQWINLYYDKTITRTAREVLDASIFVVTNGGHRIGDWALLGSGNLEGDKLKFIPRKTLRYSKVSVQVELNDIGKLILADRRELTPFFNLPRDQKINNYLKDLAEIAKINKCVTAHVFRHTFATQYLECGGLVHDLRKLMGHGNINTTMQYVHVTDKKLQESTAILNRFTPKQ